MFGNNLQCAKYAVTLSRLYSSVVVLPSYRLAPECPFPVAPNDAWDNFVWIATHAETLGADPSCGFVVGGRSAGGTLAAIIAQKANIEDFKPRISGTWLSVPMLLSEQCVPEIDRSLWISREQNKDSPVFNTEMLGVLMSAWKPDELSPHFSPFNVEAGAQRGLPTTYIQVSRSSKLVTSYY
jgi:acetyl esterase/lipase